MLASTVQFSSNPPTNPNHHSPRAAAGRRRPTETTPPPHNRGQVPVSSGPNSAPSHDVPPMSNHRERVRRPRGHLTPPSSRRSGRGCGELLRKEVIQPHLPVRLPCYDFVLIASPTFDSSLPTRGLGHRLRVLPTFMT